MKLSLKALCAAAVLVAPGAASAEAVAVALGASFKQVDITTQVNGSFEGTVDIPALVVTGNTNPFTIPFVGPVSIGVTGETAADQGTVSGSYESTTTSSSNELASISVAAAAGRNAVASAVANRHGSTGANSGASDSRSVRIAAEVDAGWTQYSSEVNIRD